MVDCDREVEDKRLAWEFVRECSPLPLGPNEKEGSRRIVMLFDLFSVLSVPVPPPFSSPSSSLLSSIPTPTPLNHPSPSSYGLASGDPFKLSILSSLRGSLTPVPGYAGVFGSTGLNVALDGGRVGRCVWLELGIGLVDGFEGEGGRDEGRENAAVLELKGGRSFWGLGEAAVWIRPIVRA